jgi:cytochrome b
VVLDNQVQHHLVELRAMIPAGATRDVHDRLCGLLITVIAAIHVKAGAIEMRKSRGEPKTLRSGGGNETVEGSNS